MNYRSILSNISVAFVAQGVAMLFGALQSLIVPKLLGVEEYGYWQLFVFYTSYAGFFHFGLNDGVYLTRGGQTRTQIDKRFINSQFVFGIVLESLVSLIIALFAINSNYGIKRTFVILSFCVMMVIINASNYIGTTLQTMNETKRSSYIAIVTRLVNIIPLIAFIMLRTSRFEPYIIAYIVSTAIGLLYGFYYMRDFIGEGLTPTTTMLYDGWNNIKIGINLMISNIAGGLIIGLVRFIIDAKWGISEFGKLSLSLSIVGLFLTFVSQASLVLFPALRQSTHAEMHDFLYSLRDTMTVFMPATYILYFPLVFLLSLWLPDYAESLAKFSYLIPICAFEGKMDIFCSTYFKVERKEKTLLCINLFSLLISAIGSIIGAYLLNSVDFILLWTVITIMIRSYISEYIVSSSQKLPHSSLSIQEVLLTIFFIFSSCTLPQFVTLLLYVLLYSFFLYINRRRSLSLLQSVIRVSHR